MCHLVRVICNSTFSKISDFIKKAEPAVRMLSEIDTISAGDLFYLCKGSYILW